MCREFDALFILDEVQTGAGATGTAWAYQQLGLAPDVVAFGKKTQVCGVMAGGRVDEVPDNVFRVSSRLNSTWGGNLTDMVRSRRILEVIECEGLIERSAHLGESLLTGLHDLAARRPALVAHPRGRGLMCAITLPSAALRDEVIRRLREEERVLMLGCGEAALRFRARRSPCAPRNWTARCPPWTASSREPVIVKPWPQWPGAWRSHAHESRRVPASASPDSALHARRAARGDDLARRRASGVPADQRRRGSRHPPVAAQSGGRAGRGVASRPGSSLERRPRRGSRGRASPAGTSRERAAGDRRLLGRRGLPHRGVRAGRSALGAARRRGHRRGHGRRPDAGAGGRAGH